MSRWLSHVGVVVLLTIVVLLGSSLTVPIPQCDRQVLVLGLVVSYHSAGHPSISQSSGG